MEQSRRLALVLAGVLFILRCTATGGIITCIGYLFQASQSASLVCHYNKDLSDRKENYMIRFCGQNSKCLDAVSCNWDEKGQGLDCVPGLTFKGMSCAVIDDQRGDLLCQLPNVHFHLSGSYTCHLVPPDGRVLQSCPVIVPWEKKEDEEKSKDEEKSNSVHEWLQTTILIVLLLAVVIATILFFIREKSKKRKGRGSAENGHGTLNQNTPLTPTSTSAVGRAGSPGGEPQHQAGHGGNQVAFPADTTQQRQSPGHEGSTGNPVSSLDPSSTSVGTMADNTERVLQAQSRQDVASHDETNGENMAEITKPLLSAFRSDSRETTNKPPKVDTPWNVYNFSTHTFTANVWMPDKNGKKKLQSPEDPGFSKHIDSSVSRFEMEANSSPTFPGNEETPKKTNGSSSAE